MALWRIYWAKGMRRLRQFKHALFSRGDWCQWGILPVHPIRIGQPRGELGIRSREVYGEWWRGVAGRRAIVRRTLRRIAKNCYSVVASRIGGGAASYQQYSQPNGQQPRGVGLSITDSGLLWRDHVVTS